MTQQPPIPVATVPGPEVAGTAPDSAAKAEQQAAGRCMSCSRIRLYVAIILLLAWFGWLILTATTKNREPIVSRAQAATAELPVVARIELDVANREYLLVRRQPVGGELSSKLTSREGRPCYLTTVTEQLTASGPAKDVQIAVLNLPSSSGYTEPGEYLLLLRSEPGARLEGRPVYVIVGQQRSPGADVEVSGPPRIYHWGPGVKAQVARLFPAKD